jgi:tetratricopeptide (TPR) repeat protein/DNA-binding XRE family transcriptional regulator
MSDHRVDETIYAMTSERNDHNPKSSEKAETLGEVVRDLRKSVGETQGTFADRFHVGRTRITEIEKDYLSAEWLRPKLIEDFPAASERIEAAINKFEPRAKRSPDESELVTIPELRRNVEHLIRDGQSEAARQLLEAYVGARKEAEYASVFSNGLRPVNITERERYWIDNQLYLLYVLGGDDKRAGDALRSAYGSAGKDQDMRNERIECAVRISRRHLKSADHFAKAHELLAEVLSEHPDAPQLWLQSGELLWIEQAYSPAYAALTTALTLQADRKEVLRLRAQVLAEWGNTAMALEDISEYLAYPSSYNVHRFEVLSAQAYVLTTQPVRHLRDGNRGIDDTAREARDLSRAEALFADACIGIGKQIGIVNYRHAHHCQVGMRDNEAALASYERAITSTYPLDPVRQGLARKYIQTHT